MGKFIEVNHVSLGGEVGTVDWAMPYLDEEHMRYALETLNAADALVLGRKPTRGCLPPISGWPGATSSTG